LPPAQSKKGVVGPQRDALGDFGGKAGPSEHGANVVDKIL
jgi:hypothetical protein